MLTPTEIKAFAGRRYREVLRAIAAKENLFPLRVPLGDWSTDDLEAMKRGRAALTGIAQETSGHGPTVVWSEVNTRRFGSQPVPASVAFQTEEDFIGYLDRQAEVAMFRTNLDATQRELPALLGWMARFPQRVVEQAAAWPDLLRVCNWFLTNPCPNCYPREVRLPIDTKFIENHRGILRQLLDEILPTIGRTESEDFHERFGLKVDEAQVRARWLGAPPDGSPVTMADFSGPLSVLAATPLAPAGVVVVENKTTFLTFPPVLPGWLALWGNGNSVTVCGSLSWLRDRKLLYWGDIDAAGLQILARLRGHWPQTQSILMDQATLYAHERWWVKSGMVGDRFSGKLTAEEWQVYDQIKERSIRLEQERILQSWVDEVVTTALASE